ncbi:MAG: hypothetical protein KME40_22415 [Komarekiella atlantica HA4396-MV6]|nr:hypothetical protein [Komarekiella atlantica HA4396-MV6]
MRNTKADRIKRICQVYFHKLNQDKVEILCLLLSQYHNLAQYFVDFFWQMKIFPFLWQQVLLSETSCSAIAKHDQKFFLPSA